MANKSSIIVPQEDLPQDLINEMKQKNERHIYIALDSDVLRSLTWASNMIYKGVDICTNEQAQKDPFISKNAEQIKELLEMANKDEVRFFISRTVFNENRHIDSVKAFMKYNCHFPDPKSKEYQSSRARSKTLAEAYCDPYYSKIDGESRPAPMTKAYSEYNGCCTPENDAYVMAQATVAGCYCVLTNNVQHFIINKRCDSEYYEKTRLKGIIEINKLMGYSYKLSGSNFELTTKPVSLKSLMNTIKKYSDKSNYLTAEDRKFKQGKEIDPMKL